MFKNIFVPLDGSSLAECVLPHVLALAKAYNAQVSLVHIMDQPAQADNRPVNPVDWEFRRSEAESYLRSVVEKLTEKGVAACSSILLEGNAAQRIIELTQEQDCDLLVLSSHGKTGLSRWNISSVVRKIVQRAHRSVMIIRAYQTDWSAQEEVKYQRLFLPLDGSKRGECALNPALTLARSHQAKLIIGSVLARPEIPFEILLTEEDQDLIHHFVERAQERITHYLESLRSRTSADVEIQVRVEDHIAVTLHEMVDEADADLVVICAHGYSGRKNWPYGGITTTFIEYGHRPLLIIQDLSPDEVELSAAERQAMEPKGH